MIGLRRINISICCLVFGLIRRLGAVCSTKNDRMPVDVSKSAVICVAYLAVTLDCPDDARCLLAICEPLPIPAGHINKQFCVLEVHKVV
tara:strand:- start:65 stop:331 length:267 start_codon:yes stop_codon:yes gene_type:complete